jgi:hypothetical protein
LACASSWGILLGGESYKEVAMVKDMALGFLQTFLFAIIVIVVLGGVMLLVNYLAAPAFGGAY